MNAFYGEGTGDILLDGVMCAGTEHNLAACGHKGWGVHNCHHKDDAGVMCEPGNSVCLSVCVSVFCLFILSRDTRRSRFLFRHPADWRSYRI